MSFRWGRGRLQQSAIAFGRELRITSCSTSFRPSSPHLQLYSTVQLSTDKENENYRNYRFLCGFQWGAYWRHDQDLLTVLDQSSSTCDA